MTARHYTAADLAPLFLATEPGAPLRARLRLLAGETAANPDASAAPICGPCRVTLYRLADGYTFAAPPDRSTATTPAREASGAELLSRIQRGDQAAALAWAERVGSWPSSCPESREISRAASAVLRAENGGP